MEAGGEEVDGHILPRTASQKSSRTTITGVSSQLSAFPFPHRPINMYDSHVLGLLLR